MIRPGTRDDLPALRTLFRGANDGPYDLALVAEEKCFGEGIAGAPHLRALGPHGWTDRCRAIASGGARPGGDAGGESL